MSEPSPIDLLMQRIEDINHKQPPIPAEDIATTIAYHRNIRERKASGEKIGKAPKADAAKVIAALDLLMSATPKAASKPLFKLKAST